MGILITEIVTFKTPDGWEVDAVAWGEYESVDDFPYNGQVGKRFKVDTIELVEVRIPGIQTIGGNKLERLARIVPAMDAIYQKSITHVTANERMFDDKIKF